MQPWYQTTTSLTHIMYCSTKVAHLRMEFSNFIHQIGQILHLHMKYRSIPKEIQPKKAAPRLDIDTMIECTRYFNL